MYSDHIDNWGSQREERISDCQNCKVERYCTTRQKKEYVEKGEKACLDFIEKE